MQVMLEIKGDDSLKMPKLLEVPPGEMASQFCSTGRLLCCTKEKERLGKPKGIGTTTTGVVSYRVNSESCALLLRAWTEK